MKTAILPISLIRHLILNNIPISLYFFKAILLRGARGGIVVKALRYKPAGRGFTVLGHGQKLLRKTGVEEQKYINYSSTAKVDGW
jgi:hypothetical protein